MASTELSAIRGTLPLETIDAAEFLAQEVVQIAKTH